MSDLTIDDTIFRKIVETIIATLDQIRQQAQTQLESLDAEYAVINKDLARANAEIQAVITTPNEAGTSRKQADWLDRIRVGEQRMTEIREETYRLRGELISEEDVTEALRQFDPVWESLSPREQARVLELLIERVNGIWCRTYNGGP